MELSSIVKIRDTLSSVLEAASPSSADLAKCAGLLAEAKVLLTKHFFLVPPLRSAVLDENQRKAVLLSRDILELGVLHCLMTHAVPAFEQYWLQLSVYYFDGIAQIPESTRRLHLYGLHLMSLLAQNRIAEFHAAIELLSKSDLGNKYVEYAVKLERAIMEGGYGRIWKTRSDVPSKLFMPFIEVLTKTVRNEVAECAKVCYKSMPVSDAATLLFFNKPGPELEAFCSIQKPKWTINNGQVYFARGDVSETSAVNSDVLMEYTMAYARELERIV